MSQGADVYKDFAEFYDLYVGDRLDDLPLYLEYARGIGTPVLEIGAGSGRLTVPLARAGVPVVAVDISPEMLELLRLRLAQEDGGTRQRVSIAQADACDLALDATYDLVIVPFYTFNYFLTPHAQDSVLRRCAAHLAPGGRLLVDVFIPWSRLAHCPDGPVPRVDTLDPRTGNRVRGWNVYTLDRERQMERRKHIFQVTAPDGTVTTREFVIQRRYFFPEELQRLFAANGLAVVEVFGGYRREPPQPASEQLMYVLRHL